MKKDERNTASDDRKVLDYGGGKPATVDAAIAEVNKAAGPHKLSGVFVCPHCKKAKLNWTVNLNTGSSSARCECGFYWM